MELNLYVRLKGLIQPDTTSCNQSHGHRSDLNAMLKIPPISEWLQLVVSGFATRKTFAPFSEVVVPRNMRYKVDSKVARIIQVGPWRAHGSGDAF